MTLEIFRIKLTDEIKSLLRDKSLLGDLPEIQALAKNVLNETANYSIDSLRSFVPVDTFELRGRSLADGMIRKRFINQYAVSVYVTDDIHKGRYNNPTAASLLAKILNRGTNERGKSMFRSHDAAAITSISTISQRVGGISTTPRRGDTTAGWIEQAERDFESKLPGLLTELSK